MSIEIRPAQVQAQIREKSRSLDALGHAVNDAYGKVDWFCGTGGVLSGEGYEAARVHMGQYKDFCLKVHECIEMTRQADSQVSNALGVFGGAARVSEQEWLDKQNAAQRQLSSLRDQANRLAKEPPSFASAFSSLQVQFSIASWENQARYAGQMLSKIYSYCAQTNNVYEGDLGKLTSAVRAGASAFAGCSFDSSTGKWGQIDYSWSSDEIEAIVSNNLNVLMFKGYGEVDRVLLVDPVANSVADWWEQNGTWITNVGKVAFGVVAIAGAVAAIMTGVGAPAGIAALIGFVGGSLDAATGIAGLTQGKNIDWEEELGKGIASTFGGDPEKAAFAVGVITTIASVINIRNIPKAAGKVLNSVRGLSNLSKPLKSGEAAHSATTKYKEMGKLIESAPLLEGRSAAKAELVRDAAELGDGFSGVADISEKGLDALTEIQKERRNGYANAATAAAGYSG